MRALGSAARRSSERHPLWPSSRPEPESHPHPVGRGEVLSSAPTSWKTTRWSPSSHTEQNVVETMDDGVLMRHLRAGGRDTTGAPVSRRSQLRNRKPKAKGQLSPAWRGQC